MSDRDRTRVRSNLRGIDVDWAHQKRPTTEAEPRRPSSIPVSGDLIGEDEFQRLYSDRALGGAGGPQQPEGRGQRTTATWLQ